jgi:pyruvate dehydrogenase E1 component alpha subunit
MMAELYGKATGYCKGKGGSMHITDMSIGMLGANGIVSGGIPIGMGAAYAAAKIRETDQVVAGFFGDGATNEGPFHEAANMAAAWNLPMIFVCENNLYGVGTRLGRISSTEDLTKRAGAYDMPAVSIDGMDVLGVRKAAAAAVEAARAGKGPTFIECKTWRYRGHFQGENPMYWDKEEYDSWFARDPINQLGRRMLEEGAATQEELDTIRDRVADEIEAAVQFAESSPMPEPQDALQDVFTTR